jgi:hypothetical protein
LAQDPASRSRKTKVIFRQIDSVRGNPADAGASNLSERVMKTIHNIATIATIATASAVAFSAFAFSATAFLRLRVRKPIAC